MMRRTPLSRASRKRQEAAQRAGSTFTGERKPLRTIAQKTREATAGKADAKPGKPRRETGFPRDVKEAVRERAAHHCEACGVPVPPGYGNIQHRLARKSGGRHGEMAAVVNSITNAVLLCGTPLTGCHGACEDRTNRHMHAQGFRLEENQDPAAEPIMLHGEYGGVKVWLTGDGWYADVPPGERGAA